MKHLFYMAEQIENAGIATPGVDLYVGTLPADVTRGVMLRDPLAGHEIDDGMRGFYSSEFQVIVRDGDPEAGYAKAIDIMKALTLINAGNDEVTVAWSRPMTLPVTYPRGDADDVETSVRFRIGFGLTDAP